MSTPHRHLRKCRVWTLCSSADEQPSPRLGKHPSVPTVDYPRAAQSAFPSGSRDKRARCLVCSAPLYLGPVLTRTSLLLSVGGQFTRSLLTHSRIWLT